MVYYKNPKTGEVYAYETVQERKEFGPSELVKMTHVEVEAHLNPPPTEESEREARDALLLSLDVIASNPLRWSALSEEQKVILGCYRQELLDIPQQIGFPADIRWPEKPSFI